MRLPLTMLFGYFLLFFTVFSFLGCNVAAYKTKEAQLCYEEIVCAVEDSHFEQDVISKMMEEGQKKGYDVMITNASTYQNKERYKIKLVYEIRIPILQIEKEREISGYAL